MPDTFDTFAMTACGRMAHGDHAIEILDDIALFFEGEVPGTTAGTTILDRTSRVFQGGRFPSLAPVYQDTLAGIEVADRPGSCALAVFDGHSIETDDVAGDTRFSQAWRDLSMAHGLEALVSLPAFQRDGIALGTFVIARRKGQPLTGPARALADRCTVLVGHVLTYARERAAHELVVGELQHRVRNIFNTIGALVYSTLRTNPDPAKFRTALDGRIAALAQAHSMALGDGDVELGKLVRLTLAPYSFENNVRIDGPAFRLTKHSAQAFALSLHELATNAAKYGALSRPGGEVAIRWGCSDDGFRFDWAESGGPPVTPPARSGFGQRTLRGSFAGAVDGKVELDFPAEGCSFRMTSPDAARVGALVN